MIDEILKTFRDNKIATGIIFILIFTLCFGPKAAAFVAIAEVFAFIYTMLVMDDDDDDHWNPRGPRFA